MAEGRERTGQRGLYPRLPGCALREGQLNRGRICRIVSRCGLPSKHSQSTAIPGFQRSLSFSCSAASDREASKDLYLHDRPVLPGGRLSCRGSALSRVGSRSPVGSSNRSCRYSRVDFPTPHDDTDRAWLPGQLGSTERWISLGAPSGEGQECSPAGRGERRSLKIAGMGTDPPQDLQREEEAFQLLAWQRCQTLL